MENHRYSTVGGTSTLGLLQVAFIVLKLCHVINWKWVWVLAPLWMSAVFVMGIILVVLTIFIIENR